MVARRDQRMNLEEYHELERTSNMKYEYADGQVYAMSGGTFEHSTIAVNLTTALRTHLRGKSCRVAHSDMKVLPLGGENPSYYPDITVTCHPEDYMRGSIAIRFPRLIIEILSPSTAYRDRGEKLRVYQACNSVEEYAMVSSHHQEIEVYHRETEELWTFARYRHEQAVTLASVGLTISVAEMYAETDIPLLSSMLDSD